MDPKTFYINIDGASKGNPGPASIGVLIKDQNGEIIKEHTESIGVQTNNFAEYTALIKSLELSKNLTKDNLKIFSDSELLVKQMQGLYKVKNKNLKPLYLKVLELQKYFKKVEYTHITRDKNSHADFLANKSF